jgi:phosphoglucosamine mutase
MLENALTAGFTSVGMDVFLLGPVPTPAVGFLTRSMRADLGVMISASHNPFHDNGIKFFGPDGFKLDDGTEEAIETMLDGPPGLADPARIGRAQRIDDGRGRYMEFAKTTFPRGLRLNGLKVVVDCANGAAYRTAPEVLWELGAEVVPLAVAPDGFNINRECGSTDPAAAAEAVRRVGADLGISLDGDADRVMIIDETGAVADGDQFMALVAERWAAEDRLAKGTLVATVMSNLGLERHLQAQGLRLLRTAVGDRYVVEAMREGGYNLGGEQSGHLVFLDLNKTGDGLITALQALALMRRKERRLSDLVERFQRYPQVLVNVAVKERRPIESIPSLCEAMRRVEKEFNGSGRVLIRYSGTEPKVRVMVEGEDERRVDELAHDLADELRRALGAG